MSKQNLELKCKHSSIRNDILCVLVDSLQLLSWLDRNRQHCFSLPLSKQTESRIFSGSHASEIRERIGSNFHQRHQKLWKSSRFELSKAIANNTAQTFQCHLMKNHRNPMKISAKFCSNWAFEWKQAICLPIALQKRPIRHHKMPTFSLPWSESEVQSDDETFSFLKKNFMQLQRIKWTKKCLEIF